MLVIGMHFVGENAIRALDTQYDECFQLGRFLHQKNQFRSASVLEESWTYLAKKKCAIPYCYERPSQLVPNPISPRESDLCDHQEIYLSFASV
mmetsp:Transcript_3466/g.6172  ORF Transcript_3466/g.6172 Transcript_3466/m.6172 type:complete len:93 (-) Transcript_3466:104-382(-)